MKWDNIIVDEEIYDPYEKEYNTPPEKGEKPIEKDEKPVTASSDSSASDPDQNKETGQDSEDSGKTTPETGAYLVCRGALCKCDKGTAPGRLKITSHSKYYINDSSGEKLIATVNDVQFEEPAFGTCAAKNNSKCKPVALPAWEVLGGDEHPTAGDNKILTDNGKLTCTAGGGKIEILAHGQVQSVSSIDMDDYSAGIENAVNCLASSENSMEGKKKKEKAASVSVLVYDGKESKGNNINITVRKGKKVIFEAKEGKIDSSKEYDPGLINWAICTRENKDETIPKLKSGNPAVYAHWGDKMQIAFNKEGFYFIEAFGKADRLQSDYTYSERDSLRFSN